MRKLDPITMSESEAKALHAGIQFALREGSLTVWKTVEGHLVVKLNYLGMSWRLFTVWATK